MASEQCVTMRHYNEYLKTNKISHSAAEVAAWTSPVLKWKKLPVKVFFLDECMWSYENNSLTYDPILLMVNKAWRIKDVDVTFQRVYSSDASDVRVSFQERSAGSWSMIGAGATTVARDTPSLVFNFNGMSDTMIKATIIHQFGHALGLGHALMEPKDWQVLQGLINQDEMRISYSVQTQNDFEVQWTGKGVVGAHYDRDSVMQYFTRSSWIKDESYRNKGNLRLSRQITDEQRESLQRFLDHGECNKDSISKADRATILRLYGPGGGSSAAPAPMRAPKSPNMSTRVPDTPSNPVPDSPISDTPTPKMYLGRVAPDARDLSFVRNPAGGRPFKLLPKIGDNWRLIGELLGIEAGYLNQWSKLDDADDRLRNIFGKWRDNAMNMEGDSERYSYTWQGLYNLLEDAEYEQVAKSYFEFLEKVSHNED